MAERKKLPKYNTPVGVAIYPHLNKADTKFNADGEYKCNLAVDEEESTDLIAYLEKIRDERYDSLSAKDKKKARKVPVFEPELDDEGEETGRVIFKTKLNAVGRDKKSGDTWTNEPKLFDANGDPLPKGVNIWSGSKLILAGTVNSYAMTQDLIVEKDGKEIEKTIIKVGVSLKCRGVQVIELVEGSGASAESYGFKPVSGGYTASAVSEADDDEEASDDEDDDDEF